MESDRNGTNDGHSKASIHMIDHAYNMSVSTATLSKAEVSDCETIFDEQTERSDWVTEADEIASDEDRFVEVVDWNEDEVEICQHDDWNGWGDDLVTDSVPLHGASWSEYVEVADESSGGEWSVNVLKRNGDWNDTESDESEKGDQATGDWNDTESDESEQGDHATGNENKVMMEDDWNVEVLDTVTDWNDDWGEETRLEAASATSNDWNVEILEHVENDWATDWNDTEDMRKFLCARCKKQYLHKSSLTKHMFLVHNKRLSHCRNNQSSDEES